MSGTCHTNSLLYIKSFTTHITSHPLSEMHPQLLGITSHIPKDRKQALDTYIDMPVICFVVTCSVIRNVLLVDRRSFQRGLLHSILIIKTNFLTSSNHLIFNTLFGSSLDIYIIMRNIKNVNICSFVQKGLLK